MVHLLSQLDPMVWLMMVVVAIGFAVSAVVLVELLPGNGDGPPPIPQQPTAEPMLPPRRRRRERPAGAARPDKRHRSAEALPI